MLQRMSVKQYRTEMKLEMIQDVTEEYNAMQTSPTQLDP